MRGATPTGSFVKLVESGGGHRGARRRLLVRYVPRELQPEVERELRLLEVSDDADVRKPTCAKK